MTPKISILIPVYNVASFIERCAHSLFCQRFDNVEFIFVNDATPDNSMVLLQSVIDLYPERKNQIVIIDHSKNKGIGATRNTLLDAAQGEYLMWVDSDDFIAENSIEMLYSIIDEKDADIVVAESYYSYNGENSIDICLGNFPSRSYEYIDGLSIRKTRAALWGTLSKRSLWTDNNISMAVGVNYGEDYYNTVRLFYFAKNIAIVNKPYYYYNKSNFNSYSTGRKTEFHFQSIIRLFELLDIFFVQQNNTENFEMFLAKAKLMEKDSLLLHTSAGLRRKYALLYDREEKAYASTIVLPFSSWQFYLLKQINRGHFVYSDIVFFVAKVMRRYCQVKF